MASQPKDFITVAVLKWPKKVPRPPSMPYKGSAVSWWKPRFSQVAVESL